jgi:arabinofuranosyltransferase
VLLLLLAAWNSITQCLVVGRAEVDDAYFTFSFAKNLALGHGPVYSHGLRVEGYSTFLWMALNALGLVFTRGQAPLACAHVIGAAFVPVLGYGVFLLARSLGASRLVAAAAVFLLSFNTDLAVAYLTGMETLPYVAAVALAFGLTFRALPSGGSSPAPDPRWRHAAAWAGLAVALLRIDGFVPFGFLLGLGFLADIWHARATRAPATTPLLRLLTTAGVPVALYLLWWLWRWRYYGLPLPSTYYAKALIPKLLPARGFEYVRDELNGGWLWCGLLVAPWFMGRRRWRALAVTLYAVLHLAYVVKVGGDWMPFGRFVLPVVPLLLVLFACATEDLARFLARWRPLAGGLTALATVVAAVLVAGHMDHRFWNGRHEEDKLAGVDIQTANVTSYHHAAQFLRQIVPPGGRLVTDYGGVFSCTTDATIIEMWGLANATIATRGTADGVNPIYGRTCPDCYVELEPEYFHVMAPLVRTPKAFATPNDVIAAVWQTDTIGRTIDFRATFAVGQVVRPGSNEALYFLQKRTLQPSFEPRTTKEGFVISYPFEGP